MEDHNILLDEILVVVKGCFELYFLNSLECFIMLFKFLLHSDMCHNTVKYATFKDKI